MKDVNWKEHLLRSHLKDARVGAPASHVGEVFQTVLRKRKLNLKVFMPVKRSLPSVNVAVAFRREHCSHCQYLFD